MATYATLTVPVLDIIGAEFNASRASVWIEPNVPLVIADSIRVGGRREQVVNGVATFTNLVTTNSADNPTSFGYRVTITAPPKGAAGRKDIVTLTTSDFPLTASANLKDISAAWDNIAIPPNWQSDFRDEMEAIRDETATISGLTGEDAAIANRIQTPGSLTDQALTVRIDAQTADAVADAEAAAATAQTAVAVGRAGTVQPAALGLAATLDMGRGDAVVHIAGDSTGNDTFEWVRKFALHLADRYGPSLRVQYRLWSDATQSYPTTEVLQAGTVSEVAGGMTTLLRDTFSNTRADLYGSTPDVTGPAWGGSTNAAADWTVTGDGFVTRTSDATVATVTSTLERGDVTATLTGIVMSTVGDTANRTFNVHVKRIDDSNYLWLRIQVTATTGVVTWNLFKTVAGVNTNLATGSATPLATNTASVTFNLSVSVTGDQFSATITPTTPAGSAATVTATLVAGDVTTFAPGDGFGFSASAGTLVGMKISDIKVDVNRTAVPGYSVTIVNGSMPGATLAYHQARIAAMFPQTAQALIVSMGHNYNGGTGADFTSALASFVTAYAAVRGTTPVIVSSQNPEFTDGGRVEAYVRAHALRFVALRPYSAAQGWGYIPVFEAFAAKPNGGRDYVHADGIHMNYDPGGPLDGGDLWAGVAADYFDAMSLRPV